MNKATAAAKKERLLLKRSKLLGSSKNLRFKIFTKKRYCTKVV